MQHNNDDRSHEANVLHNSIYGFLVHCPSCNRFQLAFGTFRITQDQEELQSFANLINRYVHRYQKRPKRSSRDIFVESPYPGIGLLFSVDDLERLNDMLQRSFLLLEAGDRVRLQ
ncbi:MAG: hypothetical protein ACI81P_001755 [Neolewinella sp.]|jgi:hypothetical protein